VPDLRKLEINDDLTNEKQLMFSYCKKHKKLTIPPANGHSQHGNGLVPAHVDFIVSWRGIHPECFQQ
jgi:hypothetical protein